MLERNAQRSRAIQVGMLMRAYRESFPLEDGTRGLTQDELLRRMASVDGDYVQRYSHTTVSRWESGSTRPSAERLEVFGKALNLSTAEVSGLMVLAGFAPDSDSETDAPELDDALTLDEFPGPYSGARIDHDFDEVTESENAGLLGIIPQSVRHGFITCAFPGLAIVGIPFLLAAFGWNQRWMPIALIGIVLGVRLAAGYLKMMRPYDLCEFMSVSVFVILTTPLLQSALLHADYYGFYAIGNFAGTPTPYMLALLVNLFLSTMAGGLFFVLWKSQYAKLNPASNPVRRALTVVVPPWSLVFITMVVFTNAEMLIQIGLSLAALTTICVILLVLRDPTVIPNDRDRRFMLLGVLVVGTILTVTGGVMMVAIYLAPNYPSFLLDHNLLFSWDIDYDRLGYPASEAMERLNVGYLWHSMVIFIYMVSVVGGGLLAAIYRWHIDHPSGQPLQDTT